MGYVSIYSNKNRFNYIFETALKKNKINFRGKKTTNSNLTKIILL